QGTNSFSIRASGSGMTPAIDGFHFVYQQMAGDAEVVAHLEKLDSPSGHAQTGLMIRQTLGPESANAVVLVNQGEAASFQYRVTRKKPGPTLRGSNVVAPCWLKLEKKDKFYVGSVSEDGNDWKVVGGQTINLGPARNPQDQWFIGLAISSRTNSGVCRAVFDDVRVHSFGLNAEYFSDDFHTLGKSEILTKLDRSWDNDRPFGVRCTGAIIPKLTQSWAFLVEPKDT